MPSTTVNLMWLGRAPLFDSSPTTNITQTQANAINGWTAEGTSGIHSVSVTGNYYNSTFGNHFNTSYQGNSAEPPSTMSYNSPATNAHVANATINTFTNATFTITVHDANGVGHDVTQTGVLMQTSSGDIFFRPSVSSLPQWNNIDRISKVVVSGVTPLSNTTYPATIGFTSSVFELTIVCFAKGTMISTAAGDCEVERLQVGDLVQTKDNGLQPVRWLGRRHLTQEQLQASPHLRPIRIEAGALGQMLPHTDLLVSPQHRILVSSRIAQRMFGTDELLVAAKQLLELDGISVATDLKEVEYHHILLARHEILLSNGAETETLYLGPEALRSVGAKARNEILSIFPEVQDPDFEPTMAREALSGKQARKLAGRHVKNEHPIIETIR